MCGRYTLRSTRNDIAEAFDLDLRTTRQLELRFNIAPSQSVATVLDAGDGRQLVMLRWGLIPSWAKDPSIGDRMINARAETVMEKASYRIAFAKRRCLVLADGYYEWQKRPREKRKQPYYIRREDDRPFAFAGLWECWRGRGESIASCTIITTEANDLTRSIHERMPVILDHRFYDHWLDPEFPDPDYLQDLLRPYPSEDLIAFPVSTLVNSPANDGPACIDPLEAI